MRLLASAAIMTLLATPQVALAQGGPAPYCLQSSSGQTKCSFGTMGQCEAARRSQSSSQCITRSDATGTIGLGLEPRQSPPAPNPLFLPPRPPSEDH